MFEEENIDNNKKIYAFFSYFREKCPNSVIGNHNLDNKRVCKKCKLKSISNFKLSREGIKYYEKYKTKYEKLYTNKKVLNIFNKIVPEINYDNEKQKKILKEFINFVITEVTTEIQIIEIINIILNKVCLDHTYVNLYASICLELKDFTIKGEKYTDNSIYKYKKISFRHKLIHICIDKNITYIDNFINNKIDGNIKRHFINNTKFLSELFNYNMIHLNLLEQYIEDIILLYFQYKKEKKINLYEILIVSIIELFSVCGKNLDSKLYKNKLNSYFKTLSEIKDTSSRRIKYLIMDLEDLRERNKIERNKRERIERERNKRENNWIKK